MARVRKSKGICAINAREIVNRALVSGSPFSTIQNSLWDCQEIKRSEVCHESAFEREKNLRELQIGEASGAGVRYLHKSAS
jgi:hypothetical protein